MHDGGEPGKPYRPHGARYLGVGVNRLSIGVQSFDDDVLRTLGRIHDSAAAREAVAMAHERFQNVSIDLMCGIPGQSAESFGRDVALAVQLGVKHVSVYPLSIEDGTPFGRMVDEGRMAFRPAVELSYLSEAEQHQLCEAMEYADAAPSLSQAIQLKQFSQQGKLFPELMETILSEEKPNQREKISFRADRLRKYIPGNVPAHKTEEYILRALEHYRQFQEKSPERVKDGKKPADTFARL
jgi:radical SAM superfamily enzyme YgiQ (UPF0313 family)